MADQIFTTFHPNPPPKSYISLANLAITPGLWTPDIWTHTSPPDTKSKLQPATLSLHLRLRSAHGSNSSAAPTKREPTSSWSAADKDELDETTVHYGLLSKALRRKLEEGGAGTELERVVDVVGKVLREEGRGAVEEFVGEVRLSKAGMWSDEGVVVRWEGGTGRRGVCVEGMRVMCLVGVNANERRARQPVVVSVWVYYGKEEGAWMDVMRVEQVLAEIIEETAFETLESLAEFAMEEIQERLLRRVLKGGWVQLRLQKPRAVAFADAPAIEVLRPIESQGRSRHRVELAVVKPYVG